MFSVHFPTEKGAPRRKMTEGRKNKSEQAENVQDQLLAIQRKTKFLKRECVRFPILIRLLKRNGI